MVVTDRIAHSPFIQTTTGIRNLKAKLAEIQENTEKVLKINSWSLIRTIFVNR